MAIPNNDSVDAAAVLKALSTYGIMPQEDGLAGSGWLWWDIQYFSYVVDSLVTFNRAPPPDYPRVVP